ncbi:MAG: hypothetical protein E7572_05130 [Ruminococcaceae bacterium]|nr:hypothetical protein [Oscillospiraceae bacterium]
MGGVLLLVIARMLLGLIDSIQQEHKQRKQKRGEKRQHKENGTQQLGLCSTMYRDIANDAVDTMQALIQSQRQPDDKPAGGNTMRTAIATIDTDAGTMTIYYNGKGEALTAETADGNTVDECEYTAQSLQDARDAARMMWGYDGGNVWGYQEIA